MNELCTFGCGQLATHQFKNGRFCCSKGSSSCPVQKIKNSTGTKAHIAEYTNPNDRWKNGHPKGSKGKPAYNKGKTYTEIYGENAETVANKISKANSGINWFARRDIETQELSRQKASENAKKRHAIGWDNKAGRCAKIKYTSPIAGNITLDGSWEHVAAQYFDLKRYNWKRNKTRFPYICPLGNNRNYTPDFWVQELGGYVEVKGYETELDRAKWKSFPNKLTVWKRECIKAIQGELGERSKPAVY